MKIHSLGSASRSTYLPALNAQGIYWKDTIREKSGEKEVNGWSISRLASFQGICILTQSLVSGLMVKRCSEVERDRQRGSLCHC
jgi:hypothetical protein